MSSGLETQKVRLKVNFKKVTMNIKFPCSLTVQIKHDSTTDSKKLHELKNGECNMTETLESQCEVTFNQNKMKYQDKKININIFMVSMSGKVASGSVSFSLFGKEAGHITECVQFLEKCPDKQAKIYYSFSFEMLRKAERLDKTFFSEFKQDQVRRKQGYNSVYLTSNLMTPKSERDKDHWKNRRSPSPHHELNESLVEGVTVFDKQSYKNDQKYQRMHTNLSMQEQMGQVTLINRDRSKSKKVIRENLSSRDIAGVTLTERFQTQAKEDEDKDEIQKLRIKIRNLQRNDKGTTQTLRETKEEGERRKNKINQLQSAKFELQEALRSKEEKIRRLEKLWKDLSEQKQEGDNQYRTLKTQFDLRENITKDQIKKLELKYAQSESEREKITEEYNRALKTFEEGEKKYQTLIKEKDRVGFEEKGRINKKLEQQTIAYGELQKQVKEMKVRVQDLLREKKQLYEDFSLSEANLSSSKNLVESLNSKLKSQTQKIQKLEEDIEQFKISESQKQQIKKKMNQLTVINGSLSENLQKKDKIIENMEIKIKEMEQQIQKKNNDKNQLNQRLNQLKKSYDNLKMNQQQKTKESQSLVSMNQSATSRIYDLKQKLQMEKRSLEDTHRDYSSRYNMILRERDSFITQNEEIRWELSKLGTTVEELSLQNRSQNEEIFRLNEEILEKNQKIKKMDESYKQLSTSHDHITIQNAELQRKKRELTGYCKERDHQNVEIKKKLDRSQRQNLDFKERIKAFEISAKEKTADFQKKLKDKEDGIQLKTVQIQGLTLQLRDSSDENSLLKQTLMTSQQQISHLKDMIVSNRRELDGQQNLILKLKQNQNQYKKSIDQYEIDIRKRKEQIEIIKKKAEKVNDEFISFKNICCAALENFLSDLLKEEETPSTGNQILKNRNGLYPDQRIAALQVEYLQKHWQNSSKQRVRIAQLLQDKDVLQYEISRVKINIEELSKKSQFDIISQRDKIKLLYSEISKKEEAEREELHKNEEMLMQKEKEIEQYKSSILKLKEQESELHSQIQVLIGQYDSLKDDNRELEQRLLQARSQEIKDKADWEGKTKETAELFQEQISQLRYNQVETEKKMISLEKQLGQKVDLLKKYEMDQNVLTYEKEKKDIRVQELTLRAEEYQTDLKEYEKQLRQKERELKKMSQTIDQLGGKLREEKEKLEQLMFKNQEQNHVIFELNREIEKNKEELIREQQRNEENQTQNRQKLQDQKTILMKQTLQIKDLKQKHISLTSELQLKKFVMVQLEQSSKIQKDVKEELKSELEKKKNSIYQLTQETSALKYQLKQAQEHLSLILNEKELLSVTVERLKQNINQIRVSSQEELQNSQTVLKLEKEIEKIKQEKNQQEQFYQRTIQDLKSSLRESKKTEASRTWKEQQLRKKLKITQKLLESNHPDLALEKNRVFKDVEKDKRELYSKNETLESKIDQLQDELSASRQRLKKETEKFSTEVESLKEEMTSKDFIIRNQQLQLENIAFKVNDLVSEKSRIQSELEKERSRFKKNQADFQNEQKSYKEKMKKMQEVEIKTFIGELERKLEVSRNRRMEGNFNELERVIVSGSYREIQDIVRSVAKEKKY